MTPAVRRRSAAEPLPVRVTNYLNLLTQLLMPRALLLVGGEAELLRALLAGCEAHPYRYNLAVADPTGKLQLPRRRWSGRGRIRFTHDVPRGRRKLIVVDMRTALLSEDLPDRLQPGGLLWCYGVDARRGRRRQVQAMARARGWLAAYQPWGGGIFCAGPPGKPRVRAAGIAR